MIKTEGLSKRFGTLNAVDNLSLEVANGEIFGFLGPNGAGKTTTIRMLCALVAPTSGAAWVAGHKLGDANERIRQSIGLLTESPGLYDRLSAWDNLAFYARLHDFSAQQVRERVGQILEWLGLDAGRKDPVAGYSKGMRQKLAIGRALLHNPRVLFLDEPTAGLDIESTRLVRETLLSLRSSGRTLFITTHNFDEAERLCDRVAIFRQSLRAIGTPEEVRRRMPADVPQPSTVLQPSKARVVARASAPPSQPQIGSTGTALSVRLRGGVPPMLLTHIKNLPFVTAAELSQTANTARLVVRLREVETYNPDLIRAIVQSGGDILYVEELAPSLEEAYLQFTRS